MTKSKTYWERRSAERLLDNLKDADKMVNSLRSDYQESILNINESIEKLYGKFAADNVVSYNQAVSLIQGKEYKKWRMSMEKYLEEIAKGDEALSLELNALCMKKRITRLEAIRAEIYANCGKLAKVEEDKVTETLTNALERNYYSSMYDYYLDRDKKVLELMHGHQVALSKANIDRVLRMPWSGENYSKNIWKSKYQIANKLQKAVTRSILEGKSIENLTRDVSTELGNDLKHSVRRLIHTETAYVKSQGDLLTYDKLGVDEYEFLATLDSRTSSICRSLDGEHFKLEDATPGVNYPPMHPYCRSTTIVYRAQKDGTRAARDDEGETYKVDANLNYKDWYKKYVSDQSVEYRKSLYKVTDIKSLQALNNLSKSSIINIDKHEDLKDYFNSKFDIKISNFDKKDIEEVKVTLAGVDDIITKFPMTKDGIVEIIYNHRIKSFGVTHGNGIIEIGKKGLSNYNTGLHEAVHALDMYVTDPGQKSLSEKVARKALKNLGLRSNSRKILNLSSEFIGPDIKELKNFDEWLSYAVEAEYTNSSIRNEITKEMVKIFEEELK